MTGKSEENGAGAADWLAAMQMALMKEVEAAVEALPQARPKGDADSAALDRHARAIANLARAAKAVGGLAEPPGRGRREPAGEDMSKEDFDDIDAEELVRIQCRLESKLERVARTVEAKRVAGWAVSGADPLSGPAAAGIAVASDFAPGR